ncbi:hypothetical protein T492DRAFT_1071462 [Pavlovales sp. CCMP2436]|nr:hypothetical protein T492DRAFT_1071462 [Pavlovales sp. CCMP2436]|mmetsp:Transcript_9738/g.24533  ORF Transcript_9738/g.24533 Transcript_9738/m.24533 type:complete len:169 (-) Transcript_9738:110-616(-)
MSGVVGRVVYRSPWVLSARMVLRAKVLQVGALVGMGAPAFIAARAGDLSLTDYAILGSTLAGSMVVAGSLSYISKRFVGEIKLREDARDVIVSTLSVWGNRIDHVYPIAAVVPLTPRTLQVRKGKAVPLAFGDGQGKQHVVILRDDHVVDQTALFRLITRREPRTKVL